MVGTSAPLVDRIFGHAPLKTSQATQPITTSLSTALSTANTDSTLKSRLKPLTGSMNAGFVDTAAADAWDRITRLFDAALR